MLKLKRAVTVAVLLGWTAASPMSVSGAASTSTPPAGSHSAQINGISRYESLDPETRKILARVRATTARFTTPSGALRAGYVEGPVDAGKCVTRDGGVRGYHYSNMKLMENDLDLDRPAVLVYQPVGPNGSLRLVAVEWFSLDRDGDPSTDDDRPSVGSQPFEGPIADIPNVPVHYYAIAWINQNNPRGIFADTNPAGTCKSKWIR